jgi:hypothetical protein
VRPVDARREKARRYARLRPGLRIGGRELNAAYFLPELRPDARLAPVPTADRAAIDEVMSATPPELPGRAASVREVSREEIDRHWPGRSLGDSAYDAELELVHPVAPFSVDEHRAVDVRVTNRGDSVWSWGNAGEPPIRLAVRWHGAGIDAAPAVRTALPADLAPGATAIVPVHVVAPARSGRFRLEIDLVHEHVRWFGRPVVADVDVEPRRRIAIVGGDDAAKDVLRLLERHPEVEPVLVARDDELPWEPPGHDRVPGVRSYLFGGDPDQPGSLTLGATVLRRGLALVRGKNLSPGAASFLDALVSCRLLVVAGLDAPAGAPPPRELARIAAVISAARARAVRVAVRGDALPTGNSRVVRLLRRFVSSRATLVYTDAAELDRFFEA